MLPEITVIHCFIAIIIFLQFPVQIVLKTLTFKCVQKLELSIALLQFTVETVPKTLNFQNATRSYNYPVLYCNLLSKRY